MFLNQGRVHHLLKNPGRQQGASRSATELISPTKAPVAQARKYS